MKNTKMLVIKLEVMMNNNQAKISDVLSREDLVDLLKIVKGETDVNETPFPTIMFPAPELVAA